MSNPSTTIQSLEEQVTRKRKELELKEATHAAKKAKREAEVATLPALIVGSVFTGEVSDSLWRDIYHGEGEWTKLTNPKRIEHSRWCWRRIIDGTYVLEDAEYMRYEVHRYRNIIVQSSDPICIGVESDDE